MKLIIIFIGAIFISGCSFKKDDEGNSGGTFDNNHTSEINLAMSLDDDGDMVSNGEEIKKGLNPKIANIPIINIDFGKEFLIKIHYKAKNDDFVKTFEINTRLEKELHGIKLNPSRSYLYDLSKLHAAKGIKTSSYNSVELPEYLFRRFTSSALPRNISKRIEMDFYKEFNLETDEITNIEIEIENFANSSSSYLKEGVEDLELAYFLYSDVEKKAVEVKRGVVKTNIKYGEPTVFNVSLDNLPVELFLKRFFNEGKILDVQIEDYKFKDSELRLKEILASVLKKSIPVGYIHPNKTSIQYVSVKNGANKFVDIVNNSISKKVTFSGDELVGVDDTISEIGNEIDSLNSLEGEYRKGKWFVATNVLSSHYLSNEFTVGDSIIMSYFLGDEISKVKKKDIVLKRQLLSSEDKRVFIGNFLTNSKVDISLSGHKSYGERYRSEENVKIIICTLNVHSPYSFNVDMKFDERLELYGNKIFLSNGIKSISIKELAEKGLVRLRRINNAITISTDELSKIFENKTVLESPLYLYAEPIVEKFVKGYEITEVEYYRVDNCVDEARQYDDRLPVYLTPFQVELYLQWDGKNSDKIYGNILYDLYEYKNNFSFYVSGILNQYY